MPSSVRHAAGRCGADHPAPERGGRRRGGSRCRPRRAAAARAGQPLRGRARLPASPAALALRSAAPGTARVCGSRCGASAARSKRPLPTAPRRIGTCTGRGRSCFGAVSAAAGPSELEAAVRRPDRVPPARTGCSGTRTLARSIAGPRARRPTVSGPTSSPGRRSGRRGGAPCQPRRAATAWTSTTSRRSWRVWGAASARRRARSCASSPIAC